MNSQLLLENGFHLFLLLVIATFLVSYLNNLHRIFEKDVFHTRKHDYSEYLQKILQFIKVLAVNQW